MIVARQERTKRSGVSERCAIGVGLQGGEKKRSRGRNDHVAVREGVVVLGSESDVCDWIV